MDPQVFPSPLNSGSVVLTWTYYYVYKSVAPKLPHGEGGTPRVGTRTRHGLTTRLALSISGF